MTGEGVWAQLLRQRTDKAIARLGFKNEKEDFDFSQFTPPRLGGAQAELF
jgi:hypothetical protein